MTRLLWVSVRMVEKLDMVDMVEMRRMTTYEIS